MAKVRLTAQEQRTILIVGALGILILYVYATYVMGPLIHRWGDLGRQGRAAREQLKLLQAATANEASLKEQHRELKETVASLQRLLPAEEELPAVIELLSSLASQSQVKIQSIFPQRSAAEETEAQKLNAASIGPVVYTDVLIQIDALGGFHQLGTLLSLVEAGEKPMRLSSLRISADPKDPKLHIKLLLQAYFATKGAGALGNT